MGWERRRARAHPFRPRCRAQHRHNRALSFVGGRYVEESRPEAT
jgi:hypothetical protein